MEKKDKAREKQARREQRKSDGPNSSSLGPAVPQLRPDLNARNVSGE
ncbi:MAG: hypothetical protein KDA90_06235 [Planctomycetaceae bacterium]|nr:hypothetical protein [Planctomycetaceae bacterium]